MDEETLRQEIIAEAKRRGAEITAAAEAECKRIREVRIRQLDGERVQKLGSAAVEAERHASSLVHAVNQEKRKRWLLRQDSVCEEVFQETLAKIPLCLIGYEGSQSLAMLLDEALQAIGPGDLIVEMNPRSAQLLDAKTIDTVARRRYGDAPFTIRRRENQALQDGLIVAASDGHVKFDNTYAGRLERFRPKLRPLVMGALESGDE